MKWKTITEVAKIQPNNATVTHAECTLTVDAATAICSLACCGSICFDLDGNLRRSHHSNLLNQLGNLFSVWVGHVGPFRFHLFQNDLLQKD